MRKEKFSKRTIRRSHIISTYGVGSIYQFKNRYSIQGESDSLMLAGLDEWFDSELTIPEEWKIHEPRLQNLLSKNFFVNPPDYRTRSEDIRLNFKKLPYIRFPNWHRCFSCGWMKKESPFKINPVCNSHIETKGHKAFKKCSKNKVPKSLIPVRFIVTCNKGHIDDFPFFEWVHQGKNYHENDCHLKIIGGKQGNVSLAGLTIKCVTCDTRPVSLAAFFGGHNRDSENPENGPFSRINYKCTGRRPWLNSNQKCEDKNPKVILRGASNAYYSVVKSSIYIPLLTEHFDQNILDIVDHPIKWNAISKEAENKKDQQDAFKTYIENLATFSNVNSESLFLAVNKKLGKLNEQIQEITKDNSEENYRFQEYNFIINKKSDGVQMLKKQMNIEEYDIISNFFENIFLISRLIETRVQMGFTRLLPYDDGMKAEYIQSLSMGNFNWLPGMVVRGEGIFLQFKKEKLDQWISSFNSSSIESIKKNYNQSRKNRGLSPRNINTKFILIHTFAHILINQLSYSCGYASASLRERVYCNLSNKEKEMQGVLIYTSSGDSEGTLGGLVREGEPQNLIRIVLNAFKKALNCSYDPVCLETTSQGLGGVNASSCHACTFLAETSCEEGNQLLDRTTIIGNGNNLNGYFQEILDA
jgi:hypothetical protein